MKKSFLLAAMSLLLLVGLTSMATAEAPDNTTCQAQCEYLVDAGYWPGTGACLSACNTCINPSDSAGSSAVCQCKLIENYYGDVKNVGFKNFGDCVKYFKNLFS